MDPIERFWELATDLIGNDGVEEGTMMGTRCLRADGEFFAMPEHRGRGLIAKLPAERVDSLIAGRVGEPFAPAGRVFKEWVLVPADQADRWPALMDEARAFVS